VRGTFGARRSWPWRGGRLLVGASRDGTLRVWSSQGWEVLAALSTDYGLSACAVAPDGVTIVAGDTAGGVHFLRLEGMARAVAVGETAGTGGAAPASVGRRAGRTAARAAKIGRNDPCPCGSGKKYSKCHGAAG
jgi:hypothetical protein